jgi:hypothetical protein
MIGGGQSPKIGPGQSSVARTESIESSSSEEIQFEKNHTTRAGEQNLTRKLSDDDLLHRRGELDDPEQEFVLRLKERHGGSVDGHAILQCVLSDLKTYSDLKSISRFRQKTDHCTGEAQEPAGPLSPGGGKVLRIPLQAPGMGHPRADADTGNEDRRLCRPGAEAIVFARALRRDRRMLE